MVFMAETNEEHDKRKSELMKLVFQDAYKLGRQDREKEILKIIDNYNVDKLGEHCEDCAWWLKTIKDIIQEIKRGE